MATGNSTACARLGRAPARSVGRCLELAYSSGPAAPGRPAAGPGLGQHLLQRLRGGTCGMGRTAAAKSRSHRPARIHGGRPGYPTPPGVVDAQQGGRNSRGVESARLCPGRIRRRKRGLLRWATELPFPAQRVHTGLRRTARSVPRGRVRLRSERLRPYLHPRASARPPAPDGFANEHHGVRLHRRSSTPASWSTRLLCRFERNDLCDL